MCQFLQNKSVPEILSDQIQSRHLLMKQKDSSLEISKDDDESIVQNDEQLSHLGNISMESLPVKGYCQTFISIAEKQTRQPNIFETPTKIHQNWDMLACHARNIQYTQINLRSPKTLQNCLQFICQQYFPYYKEIMLMEQQRKRFQLFLYDRIKSIRCQLYVQKVFDACLSMKLIKIILFLQVMIGQQIQLIGLQQFFNVEVKSQLLIDDAKKKYLIEALQLGIYWIKKSKLICFIADNYEQILANDKLAKMLARRIKIQNDNYYIYLVQLSKNENHYIRLVLWSRIKQMRDTILRHYKKAKMNQKASFLCRVLGYSKMEGQVNISKNNQLVQLEKHKISYDLQIKLWIAEGQLLQILDEFIQWK